MGASEYNCEYDVQQELEKGVSKVESKLTVQGVASHAGSDAVSDVESKIDQMLSGADSAPFYEIESKLDLMGPEAVSEVESKLENILSAAPSAPLSVIASYGSAAESKLDALGPEAVSEVESKIDNLLSGTGSYPLSMIESKLETMGVFTHAGSVGVSNVESKIIQMLSGADSAPFFEDSVALSHVESKIIQMLSGADSAPFYQLESKLDVMGVTSLAGSLGLSDVESKLDLGERGVTDHYLTRSAADVLISAGCSWTELFQFHAPSHTLIKCVKITNTLTAAGTCVYRITDSFGGTKLFPYGASKEYDSGDEYRLAEPLHVKKSTSYCLEIACSAPTTTMSAAMTEMKVIEKTLC